MPSYFMMHAFCVGGCPSTFLTRMVVDEIMKIGGWKTQSVSKYYFGATPGGQVQGRKRKCGQSYADVSELPLSSRVREMIETMLREFG